MPASVLNFWRKMLAFRKQYKKAIVFGEFLTGAIDEGPVFAYRRVPMVGYESQELKSLLVVLNLTGTTDAGFTIPANNKDGNVSSLLSDQLATQGTTANGEQYLIIVVNSRTTPDHNVVGRIFKATERIELRPFEGVVLSFESSGFFQGGKCKHQEFGGQRLSGEFSGNLSRRRGHAN